MSILSKRGFADYAYDIINSQIFNEGFNVIVFDINVDLTKDLSYEIETFLLSQKSVLSIDPLTTNVITFIMSSLESANILLKQLSRYISLKLSLTIEPKIISKNYMKYFFYCSYLTNENIKCTEFILSKNPKNIEIIQSNSIYNALMFRYINNISKFINNIKYSSTVQFKSKLKNTDKIISYYLSLN